MIVGAFRDTKNIALGARAFARSYALPSMAEAIAPAGARPAKADAAK